MGLSPFEMQSRLPETEKQTSTKYPLQPTSHASRPEAIGLEGLSPHGCVGVLVPAAQAADRLPDRRTPGHKRSTGLRRTESRRSHRSRRDGFERAGASSPGRLEPRPSNPARA